MADEDKFADEIMSDEELEKVAGGFYARSNGGEVEKDPAVKIENQRLIIIG